MGKIFEFKDFKADTKVVLRNLNLEPPRAGRLARQGYASQGRDAGTPEVSLPGEGG